MIDWLRKWFEQDDFVDDWYGWLTNQIGHISLGVMCALAVSVVWFLVVGEFPVKAIIWPAIAAVYILIEIARGWTWADSAEDTVFFAGYGCGGAFLVFSEVTPGSPMLTVSALDMVPILGIACVHLAAGVFVRLPGE